MPEELVRRPLKTRSQAWTRKLAFGLIRIGLQPNHVSIGSVFFAVGGAVCFAFLPVTNIAGKSFLLLGAAACIQLRLLCNLLDGLMAVEGGKKTRTGEMYNELPDRIADVLFLVAAGYAAPQLFWNVELGWVAALLALMTAYLRAFGGSLGLKQNFCGPMAKPHRMFTLTMGCLLGAGEIFIRNQMVLLNVALWVIVAGSVMTCVRRAQIIAVELRKP